MNSLQLVSKIRSKADDLSLNISEMLHANHQFSSIDKALLSKQCLDVYELILKLKTDNESLEEKPESLVQTKNFQEVINWADENAGSLDEVSSKVDFVDATAKPIFQTPEIQIPVNPATSYPTPVNQEPVTPAPITPAPITKALEIPTSQIPRTNAQETQIPVNPATSYPTPVNPTPVNQPPITKAQEIPTSQIPRTNAQETQPTEVNHPIEININKATENKRIQYTVMPPIEEPKTVPLNATFEGKELSYNDKIAQVNPPIAIPLAEKTIEAPIDSIKSAINLNKKIAFVNILFHENVVEYAKAIERLNQALDRNDAFRIHNELKHQHNWENSNELVQDLERLIKRRFA